MSDRETTPTDDLDVRLRWPEAETPTWRPPEAGTAGDDAGRDGGATPSPDEYPRDRMESEVGGRRVDTDRLIDATQGAISSLGMRLDAVSAALTTLRSTLADRLTDFNDQVSRALSTNTRDLEDYRRLHERTYADIQGQLTDIEATLGRSGGDGPKLEAAIRQQGAELARLLETQRASTADDLAQLLETQRASTADDLAQLLETQRASTTAELNRHDSDARDELLLSITDLSRQNAEGRDELQRALTELTRRTTDGRDELLHAVDDSMGRLASAHAEDLEHIVERVDETGERQKLAEESQTDLAHQLSARLEQIDTRLSGLEALITAQASVRETPHPATEPATEPAAPTPPTPPPAPSSPPDLTPVIERLDAFAEQIEALRRRISLRARGESVLDPAVVDALADALAERLEVVEGPTEMDPVSRRQPGQQK